MQHINKFSEFINESSGHDQWAQFREWFQQNSDELLTLKDILNPEDQYFDEEPEMIEWIESALASKKTRMNRLGLSNESNVVCIMDENEGPWDTGEWKPDSKPLICEMVPEMFTKYCELDLNKITTIDRIDYSQDEEYDGAFEAFLFDYDGVNIVKLITSDQSWLFVNRDSLL